MGISKIVMTRGPFPLGCAGAWNALAKPQGGGLGVFQDRVEYAKTEFTFCSVERRYSCKIWHLAQEAKAIAHEKIWRWDNDLKS